MTATDNKKVKLYKETIKELDEYSSHLNEMILSKDEEIDELDHKTKYLIMEHEREVNAILKSFVKKFDQKQEFELQIEQKDQKIEELRKRVEILEQAINQQKQFIGKYRGSVVFPAYKLTSNLGKTAIGQIMQRILK